MCSIMVGSSPLGIRKVMASRVAAVAEQAVVQQFHGLAEFDRDASESNRLS